MEITIGNMLAGWFDELLGKPKSRHTGDGRKRAVVRRSEHAAKQAARVAPALAAFAEKRAASARHRVRRWQRAYPDLSLADAPGHIKAKSREQASR